MLYPHVLSSLILWLLKLVWYLTRVGKNSHMKYGLYSFKYNLSFNFFYACFLVRNDAVSNGCIYLYVLWTICIHFLFLHYLLTLSFTPGYYSILADRGNLTFFTEFLLMDISSSRELQNFQGLLFLLIYLGAMAGNLLTITAIATDPHLHSPMHFCINNLSLIDLCCISVSVPKLIVNSLVDNKPISLKECVLRFSCIFFLHL